jgi:glyoxylate/hydroxypyruvate reductase A
MAMAVLLASVVGPAGPWEKAIRAAMPEEDLRTDPEAGPLDDIDVALFARRRPGLFPRLTNLKLIVALQAGVDSLLEDPELPSGIPIVRAGQPGGDRLIAEYVLMQVLMHHRNMATFIDDQRTHIWNKLDVPLASEGRVGFMGAGLIGGACVEIVRDIGFQVATWTRRPKELAGIESFHGAAGLEPFLARSDILVNVLPLTADTENILNGHLFTALPTGARIINIGRGQHVVDDDLIAALDSGHLAGATLDVFRKEPLPPEHPFWAHEKIIITPHTARKSRPGNVAPQVADAIRRLRAGQPLPQIVDRAAGY